MNKLGYWEYVLRVADNLTETYGHDYLWEGHAIYGAVSVIKNLREFLYFSPTDLSQKELKEKIRELIIKHCGESDEKTMDYEVKASYKACGKKPKGL